MCVAQIPCTSHTHLVDVFVVVGVVSVPSTSPGRRTAVVVAHVHDKCTRRARTCAPFSLLRTHATRRAHAQHCAQAHARAARPMLQSAPHCVQERAGNYGLEFGFAFRECAEDEDSFQLAALSLHALNALCQRARPILKCNERASAQRVYFPAQANE